MLWACLSIWKISVEFKFAIRISAGPLKTWTNTFFHRDIRFLRLRPRPEFDFYAAFDGTVLFYQSCSKIPKINKSRYHPTKYLSISIYIFLHLSISIYVSTSIYLSMYRSIYTSVYLYLSIYPCVSLSLPLEHLWTLFGPFERPLTALWTPFEPFERRWSVVWAPFERSLTAFERPGALCGLAGSALGPCTALLGATWVFVRPWGERPGSLYGLAGLWSVWSLCMPLGPGLPCAAVQPYTPVQPRAAAVIPNCCLSQQFP